MKDKELPEYWLKGKIEGYPDLLQPVVHSLLQSKMELKKYMVDFPDPLLWEKPAADNEGPEVGQPNVWHHSSQARAVRRGSSPVRSVSSCCSGFRPA